MVQDAVLLDTRHNELRHTINRRKRKLRELYQVTCATAKALSQISTLSTRNPQNKGIYSESDFLDANDLTKGRFFDVTTLRRLPGGDPLSLPHRKNTNPNGDGQQHSATKILNNTSGSLAPEPAAPDSVKSRSKPTSPTLVATNGTRNGIRSPISPDDEENREQESKPSADSSRKIESDRIPAAKLSAGPVERLPSSNSSAEHGTPATPPADTPEGSTTPKPGGVPLAASAVSSNDKSSSQDPQATTSTPESQLLQEAAQSQTHVSGAENLQAIKNGEQNPNHSPSDPVNSALSAEGSQQHHTGSNSASSLSQTTPSAQKRPMRIDTTIARSSTSGLQSMTSAAFSPPSGRPSGQFSPPERMRTRVSSGAIRHKSVSEILGETPRSASHERNSSGDKTIFSPDNATPTSRRFSQVSLTPDTGFFKRRLSDLRDRDKNRSQLSTVVFTRQHDQDDHSRDPIPAKRGHLQGLEDYLLPLFLAQASGHQTGLASLLSGSRKTLNTDDHYLEFRELQDCRILKRIYTLQTANKWSLRQPARIAEPPRQATQWDSVLAEMKWMRTDFREERKWKLAQAKNLADWCAGWVMAGDDERKALQVRVKRLDLDSTKTNGVTPESIHGDRGDQEDLASRDQGIPELVPSNDDDTSEEEDLRTSLSAPLPPATIFSLEPDDVLFGIGETPVSEKLLSELPMYNPFTELQNRAQGIDSRQMDESWKTPLASVSRWNDSKIVFHEERPRKRRKRSRYDYSQDLEDVHEETNLPPEQTNVGLFSSDYKSLVHRLHQSHTFRLPGLPIPSQAFFEFRQPSQWTRGEDDSLRKLVREYSFNWSIISSILSSLSQYSSGAERRTPWECFERWEALEGMPTEYARHDFFKRWQTRRHNAKVRHEEQFLQAQHAANGTSITPRRRNGEPLSVPIRRNSRHLAAFSAMSKQQKKRENQALKQQQMATQAANRKPVEVQQQGVKRMRTPSEFSANKHKQECEMRQKILEHRQQMQRVAASNLSAQRSGLMAGPHQGMPPVPGTGRGAVPGAGQNNHLLSTVQGGANNQGRIIPSGQGVTNGVLPNGTRAPGIPQAPAQYRQPQTNGADSARVLSEASRVSEQQRLMQQSRHYSSNLNGVGQSNMNSNLSQQSNSSFAAMQQQSGKVSPAINGQRSMSSPRGSQVMPGQQLSSGVTPAIAAITNSLKKLHPNLTDAQISTLATQHLNRTLHTVNQQGTGGPHNGHVPGHAQQQGSLGQNQGPSVHVGQSSINNGMGVMTSHAYAQAMRQQMQQQSNSQTGQGSQRPESRGMTATPQNHATPATPASIASLSQSGNAQSPRLPSAQSSGQASGQ